MGRESSLRATRTPEEIRSWLWDYVERELGIERGELRGELDLASAGVDSLEAVTLVGALEKWLGQPLPPTLLWDCQTLTEFLDKVPSGGAHGAEAARAGAPASESKHEFSRHVNPYLGRRLEQLKIDKRFVRGAGCYVYDDSGDRYIDFLAQYGALPFGYNPPDIWAALDGVREQGEPSFVQPSALLGAGELARRLLAVSPKNLQYVTFTNSGAEAVEAGIKLCRRHTGRPGILSTKHGFHGKTMGALSATGKASYQEPFGLPAADFDFIAYGSVDALSEALRLKPGFYAAFIVEPIQGEGGIVVPPPGYLRRVQELCNDTGTRLIIDEVQTGLGRTGAMFASGAAGVAPDVMVVAKALGGGLMPIGACLCSAAVYTKSFGLKHSSTFAGNALATRAGLATLDALERDDFALVRQVAANGARFKERLEAIQRRYPQLIAEVRGHGYMLGIRLRVNRSLWPESFLGVAGEEGELAALLASYLLNVERVRVAPTLNAGEVLRIEPPLTATAEQCGHVADSLERAFEVLASGDSARFYGAILDRAPRRATAPHVHPKARIVTRSAEDARFAFLMHPLDAQSFVDYDASLAKLLPGELAEFVDTMDGTVDPFISSEVRIVSKSGASAHGAFILVSRTAESLMAMPQDEAMDEIRDALDRAKQFGAEIVGLGAYVSVVTRGGLKLVNEGVPITSGNSYTVVSALDALDMALKDAGRDWQGARAAVVGAGGAIGRIAAALVAEKAERVILIGNPARSAESSRAQLRGVAAAACRHLVARREEGAPCVPGSIADGLRSMKLPAASAPASAFEDLVTELVQAQGRFILTQSYDVMAHADVVVAATSSPRALIQSAHLRAGAIVCDLSRPRSVAREIERSRPDVLVFDGGLIELPGSPYIGPYGIAPGLGYACMAETMMLALERRFEHTSLGATLSFAEVAAQRALAKKHGFGVARLQRFDKVVGKVGPSRASLREEPARSPTQGTTSTRGNQMAFLQRERETLERFCPGLDAALAAYPLTELEQPENPGIRLFRAHGGASVLVPAAHGGRGASALEALRINRALGARAPSLAIATTMHHLSVAAIATYQMYGDAGARVLRDVAAHQHLIASGFAEGQSGRDVFDAQTVAAPVSGGYRISGSKKPCSLAHSCDVIMLGVSLPHRPGQRGVALVVLDESARGPRRPFCEPARVRRREFWSTPFLAGADSHEVILDRVLVPEEMLFVPETLDSLGSVELVENGGLCWFELLVCASYLGIVSGLVERVLRKGAGNASERTLLGIEVESAMAALEGLARRIETDEVSMDLLAYSLFVRFGVQQSIARVASHAAELLGGMSFVSSADVGYLLASSRVLAYHPPSRLSMSELLAQYLSSSPEASSAAATPMPANEPLPPTNVAFVANAE